NLHSHQSPDLTLTFDQLWLKLRIFDASTESKQFLAKSNASSIFCASRTSQFSNLLKYKLFYLLFLLDNAYSPLSRFQPGIKSLFATKKIVFL
ncbi:hypothetical protein BpHYR1_038936, partial [Brachionus plicatilis]